MIARKIWFTALMLFGLFATVNGQTTHSCPSDHINDSLLQTNPVFSRSYFYMEQKLAQNHALPAGERSDDIYTLPVVVHIIHKGEPYGSGTNITDEQINSAITALNQDFRKIPGTPGFGNGPDIGIQFCLAVRDPNGQPTTGIVRVNGTSVPLYETQGIAATGSSGASEAAVKALSTWPNTSYVNIWVVSEIENNDGGNGIQGYAYFPTSSPLDGIVVLFNAFGTVGNLKSNTNMNRTLTHEMGHYFSLYHTFHGTSSCAAESSCTTQGDRVCDTPVTTQNASCTNPACSGTQQVQNYMDYTPETCQNMFSEGQKLRMRTALETQRTSMLTSLGCMPVFTRDAGITSVINPSGTNCAGGLTPRVTLTNFGSATLTSVTINYNVNGSGNLSQNWTGSLAPGSSVAVNLGSINPASGSHVFYAWTTNPNGQSDQNTVNDQSSGAFVVTAGATATLTITLDYFGSETTWQVTNSSNAIIFNGGPYVNNQQGLQIVVPLCLSPGCYTLRFMDSYGDGQGFTNGNFVLRDAANNILGQASGNWGAQSIHNFCITGETPTNPPVANFTASSTAVCRNTGINFTSTSTNSPTSFSWTFTGGTPSTSTQQNPTNITWNTAGVYSVSLTATNAGGSHTYTCNNCITIHPSPTLTLAGTSPACNNASTGSIVSTAGVNGPFTYAWSNGATTANLNNVASGTYTCTVTNTNGCTTQQSATLTNPTAINITGTTTNACAGGNNGSISVSATGGTGNKTFSWSNGATGATVNNLAAGTYTVTATDANGCTKTQNFTVTASSAINITGTTTNITCAGLTNGSITVSATGGTGSKTFSWSNGATGATVNNLAAGSYTVTATDANGCTSTQSFTITAPSAVVVTGTATNITCSGQTNGSITASATGGTGTKSFSWSNGATGATVNNLAAGSYTVTATDANGCTATQTFTITVPSAIVVTGTTTNITCSGQSNGSITVSATGGTGNKTFSWSNGATGATINNLAAGSYTVTATDASGCTKTQSFTITAPTAIVITGTATNISCSGQNNGSITVSATGGTGNKTFSWSNGATGASLNNLVAGSYTVTATDANGCTQTQSFTITAPSAIVINGTSTNISCAGQNNGSITVSATGGTGNKTFSWSNGATGATVNNLAAGSYTVTATDANGCTKTQSFTITAPAPLQLTVVDFDISCNTTTGSAQAMATGGVSPYTITWSNGSTGTSINNLSVGNYSATLTDANGCSANSGFSITQGNTLSVFIATTPISCFGQNNASATAIVSNGLNCTYQWNTGATTQSISNLGAGLYTVTVTEAGGCQGTAQITIAQPDPMNVSVFKSDISCFGLNDGTATATVIGGTAPYTYSWNSGSSNLSIQNLSPGTYTFTAVDSKGCVEDESIVVEQPNMLTANVIVLSNESCAGNDGEVTIIANGGTEGYSTLWSNGATGDTNSGLSAGTYLFTLIDANGCEINGSSTITYDCNQTGIGLTKLIATDCGAVNLALNAIIKCETVTGASMYQWKFMTTEGSLISLEYSLGTSFYVSQIIGIDYSQTYHIAVKALVSGNWGPFGDVCSITTMDNPSGVLPSLTDQYCGISIHSWGEVLVANEVPGALNYQWHITGPSYEWTTYTDINALMLDNNMQLQAGETYTVRLRCALGANQFTEWGEPCTFSIDIKINIAEYPPISGILLIYPNPGNGENIFFDFGNLPKGSTVENLILYDASGNLVEKFNRNISPESGQVQEYRFEQKLASGLYFLAYKFNGKQREEKLIVR